MPDRALRLLIIGAHPDDADHHAGGLAVLYRVAGQVVKMVSLTDGGAGHLALRGPELTRRRKSEAAVAGAVIGATYDVYRPGNGPSVFTRISLILKKGTAELQSFSVNFSPISAANEQSVKRCGAWKAT